MGEAMIPLTRRSLLLWPAAALAALLCCSTLEVRSAPDTEEQIERLRQQLQVQQTELQMLKRQLELEKAKADLDIDESVTSVSIDLEADVLFDFGKADVRTEGAETLKQVARLIDSVAGSEVVVEGHTDSVGGPKANQRLSERRAAAVKRVLVQSGISPDIITTRGFGETQPIDYNSMPDGSDYPTGRQRNRRVEITVEKQPFPRGTLVADTKEKFVVIEQENAVIVRIDADSVFDYEHGRIAAEGKALLAEVASELSGRGMGEIVVEGHTDPRHDKAMTKTLASAVKAFFVEHGIDEARISARGLGSDEPIAHNQLPDGRDYPAGWRQNRRIDVVIKMP
jgi:outer membrane protein OmpA-like peptidoglycan-associated protein